MVFGQLLFPLNVNAAPNPTQQLKPFLKKVTTVLSDEENKNLTPTEVRDLLIDIAQERFDFQEMSKRVLGRQWRNIDEEQKQYVTELFTQLLQHAYTGKIKEYNEQEIEYIKERIRGKRAEVQTLLVDTSISIPVSYIMLLKGDQWMVYDIIVEGVSLVRNYKEQFDQVIASEGYDMLVKRVEEKIAQMEKGPGQAS